MARASLGKEIYFESIDEVGTLGFFTIKLREAKVSITHLSAYAVGNKAYFQLVVDDTDKAVKVLSGDIKNLDVREVLLVEFENKTGTLAEVAKLLGQNSVNMTECYGTSSDGFKIVGVFVTGDNAKAMQLINQASGHSGA